MLHEPNLSQIAAGNIKILTNFPVLDDTPLEALHIQAKGEKGGENNDGLDAIFLSLVMLRFSSPTQECCDILGHLRGRGGCTYQ